MARNDSVMLTVKVPQAVANRIAKAARDQRRTKSEIVRDALERGLAAPTGQTVWDLVGDLAGSFGGPGDLSFNKKHLRGFGK